MNANHWWTVAGLSFLPIVIVDIFKLLKINGTRREEEEIVPDIDFIVPDIYFDGPDMLKNSSTAFSISQQNGVITSP